MTDPNPTQALQVVNAEQARKELGLHISAGADKDLDARAEHFAQLLSELDPENPNAQDEGRSSVETMATDVQKEAARMSQLLRQPLTTISGKNTEGGDVAKALINLKMEVEKIDPGKFDFEPGWLTRLVGRVPGVGTPVKRYLSRYESAQTVIQAVVRSLEQGRDQLMRDIATLSDDQKQMREMTLKLDRAVKLGQLIDQKLSARLGTGELAAGTPKNKFVSEELLFPLRQRILDLQQQLAVAQQGVLATELIIRNNKELARGVTRALNVTVTALQVGATVAVALESQKAVLDKINTVSQTTSELIAGTAARLKTQGVEIQKQASSAMLNMDSLKAAFADVQAAINDVSAFRTAALPQMASSVLELDKLTSAAEKSIQALEKGRDAKPQISIDVE
jgi:uncharacterized protein YaaN involved in tellurite resistance